MRLTNQSFRLQSNSLTCIARSCISDEKRRTSRFPIALAIPPLPPVTLVSSTYEHYLPFHLTLSLKCYILLFPLIFSLRSQTENIPRDHICTCLARPPLRYKLLFHFSPSVCKSRSSTVFSPGHWEVSSRPSRFGLGSSYHSGATFQNTRI